MTDRELELAPEFEPGPHVERGIDFRIASVLKRTCRVFGRNFFELAAFALIAIAPVLVVPAAQDGYAPVDLGLSTRMGGYLLATSALLGHSIICFIAFQRMGGRPVGLGEDLKIGLRRSLPLVGIALVIMSILGIPALILLPIWSMVMPVCVIEGVGPLRGLSRSVALTKGYRGKMLALLFLAIALGAGLLPTMRFISGVIIRSFGPPEIVGSVVRVDALTWTALWLAFFAVLLAVSYHDLRAAHGGNQPDGIAEIFE
jgi:hypothetical protein